MYRYKRGVKIDYNRQGYIYFKSRLYHELPAAERDAIKRLCREQGGEYHAALFEFVTTDRTATEITMKHHISRSTLYRAVRKYYEKFDL